MIYFVKLFSLLFWTLLIFRGKRHIALSLFRRKVRPEVARYLRTTYWPLFGIPVLQFRAEPPEIIHPASRLLRVSGSCRYQPPRAPELCPLRGFSCCQQEISHFCDVWKPRSQRKRWPKVATSYTSEVVGALNTQNLVLLYSSNSQGWWEVIGDWVTTRRLPVLGHHITSYVRLPLHLSHYYDECVPYSSCMYN